MSQSHPIHASGNNGGSSTEFRPGSSGVGLDGGDLLSGGNGSSGFLGDQGLLKITKIEPHLFSSARRTFLVLKVETDAGVSGLGVFGPSYGEQAGVGVLAPMCDELIGADPFDTEALWQRCFRRSFFPADLLAVGIISAIDMALWDIKGRVLRQPVWRLLGGRVRDHVSLYTWLGDNPTTEATVSAARRAVAAGWKVVRFSVPDREGVLEPAVAVGDAIERLAAVREAVGPSIGIVVDAHTRLDLPDAVRLSRESERYRPMFLEDPLRCENIESYRRLREKSPVPLAAGEQLATKWRFRALIEEELIDYARIDLANVGGFTEARKVAGWAETHHIKIVPHNPLGPILSAACLHFAVATPNCEMVEAGNTDDDFLKEIYPVRPKFPAVAWPIPFGPGLGVEIDESALDQNPYRQRSAPQFRRADGSFTNW